MRWDLFCRVIDNFGDAGVCWRLAADLGERGETVRLWLDDASALRWMAPRAAHGVTVHAWDHADADADPGEVVVEAFGCDPPAGFVARMARRARPPVWINLEYLSAEDFVERNHGLPSPQWAGPGRGLTKWFFHPGFTAATGGLLREPALLVERGRFDRDAWLDRQGWTRKPGERVVLLFCYENPAMPELLAALAAAPTLLLLAQGAAQRLAAGVPPVAGQRRVALPWLTQTEFDRALWSADLSFVRGEDSFVRAQWAGAPFVWQIYPQPDGVHAIKLQAFIDRFAALAADVPEAVWALWRAWNGLAPWSAEAAAALQPAVQARWRLAASRWRAALATQDDLASRLLRFASEKARI